MKRGESRSIILFQNRLWFWESTKEQMGCSEFDRSMLFRCLVHTCALRTHNVHVKQTSLIILKKLNFRRVLQQRYCRWLKSSFLSTETNKMEQIWSHSFNYVPFIPPLCRKVQTCLGTWNPVSDGTNIPNCSHTCCHFELTFLCSHIHFFLLEHKHALELVENIISC